METSGVKGPPDRGANEVLNENKGSRNWDFPEELAREDASYGSEDDVHDRRLNQLGSESDALFGIEVVLFRTARTGSRPHLAQGSSSLANGYPQSGHII